MAAEVIAELRVGRILTQSHVLKRSLGLSHKVIQKILNRIRSRKRITEVSNSPRRREQSGICSVRLHKYLSYL